MNDELTQVRQILAITRTGSFTRAAQELHISQPVLSRSIASFEARHGVRLFERGRGGAAPTTLGESVIADAAKLLRSARNFQDNLQLYRRPRSIAGDRSPNGVRRTV
jgi:DNA-binding transcriptional LysR family regulator